MKKKQNDDDDDESVERRRSSGKRIWGSSPLRFINTTRGPPATTPKLDNDDHT